MNGGRKHEFAVGDVVEIHARGEFYPGTRGVVLKLETAFDYDVRVGSEEWCFAEYELRAVKPSCDVGTFPFLNNGGRP